MMTGHCDLIGAACDLEALYQCKLGCYVQGSGDDM
jgi:hypothetical protein